MSKTSRLVVFLVAFSLVALPVFANHSWGSYHWGRTSNPFTLKVGDNVTTVWDPILSTTISDWSKSTVCDLTKVAGAANPKNCRPTAGRDEVCNSTYGSTGWLGVAQIWASGTHITQGTVKLNDTYMNTPQYNSTAWRNLVSCQEVGHTLGLDHQDENFNNANLGTCMDYTNDPSTNQHPNQHDYDQLVTIYSHFDSTTTVSALNSGVSLYSMPVADGDDLDEPWRWGTPVSWDGAGRANVFVLERASGSGEHEVVVTRVIWTHPDVEGRDRDFQK
jgi:hypothetical protein